MLDSVGTTKLLAAILCDRPAFGRTELALVERKAYDEEYQCRLCPDCSG
jgi:hypothetical protein